MVDFVRRELALSLAGACASALPVCAARAEAYPLRPVTLMVGFPPAGPVDIAARAIAPALSDQLGQSVLVANSPGESGNLATGAVVRATPDGYMLLVCGPVNVINTHLFRELTFDFIRDIAPVAGLYQVPLVIEVNPATPIDTAAEFLRFARANPGRLRVGYAGHGTPQHIAIELFRSLAGVDLQLVPFLGSAPALEALLAGRIDAMFDPMPSSIDLIRAGKLKPLAVTSVERSPALPDVAPMVELVHGYSAGSWFGIGAPRATPQTVVKRLADAVVSALGTPRVVSRIAELGGVKVPQSADAFGKFIQAESDRYLAVIRSAGIVPK